MTYLSLARKYRPQIFDEIVGQEHIATTLKNAVKSDMVAHAYIFAGPRGVGKTSTARILAKGLNCKKGPTPSPCGKCAPCVEITGGTNLDVIEIDGASNRGIDEIRNLKENIKFSSIGGKFKIYIIDEVHMLTPEAFNALLKTLEEPPAHVKFIFATTSPHKVIPTILSRCQRFDFRKISTHDIAEKLEDVRKKEKIDLKDDALFLIAKSADGSMRDAEIVLDQLLSFTTGKITVKDVTKVLGLMSQDILFNLVSAVVSDNKDKVLGIVNELINAGKDPVFIASSIIEYFRGLMIAKTSGQGAKKYGTFSEEEFHRLEEQAKGFSLDEILYVIYSLSAAMELMRKTSLSRIPLEVALIKLCEKERLTSVKEILSKLSLLEKKISETSISTKGPESKIIDKPAENKTEYKAEEREAAPIAKDISQEAVAAEKDILLLQKIKNSWNKVLAFMKTKRMSLATFLSEGKILRVKDNKLIIGFGKENVLHKEQLEESANKKFVEDIIKSVSGEKILLDLETIDSVVASELPISQEEGMPGDEDIDAIVASQESRIDPIVESALDIFDGRVVDVREAKPKERR